MANRKAPGPSGITSNILKSIVWTEENPDNEDGNDKADYLTTTIHVMILEFWEGTLVFDSWKSCTLVPVPKKGNLSIPNKLHPAYLLETTYKYLLVLLLIASIL
eukprot:9100012-Ditylum_brightwellii.AAC.1